MALGLVISSFKLTELATPVAYTPVGVPPTELIILAAIAVEYTPKLSISRESNNVPTWPIAIPEVRVR